MKKEIVWTVNTFEELTIDSLYEILNLRCKIFVVEQNAPYLDMDYKDQKALHLQGYIDNKLIAYCRLFEAGDYFNEASIGRVVVDEAYRKYGYGHDLMIKSLELLGEGKVTISAQLYLQGFYESHGFRCISETYLEDGIPHIQMKRE